MVAKIRATNEAPQAYVSGETAVVRLEIDGADERWRQTFNRLASDDRYTAAGWDSHTVLLVRIALNDDLQGTESARVARASQVLDRALDHITKSNDEISANLDPDWPAKHLVINWWNGRKLADPKFPERI